MDEKPPRRAWVAVLRASIVPLILGAIIFYVFLYLRARYSGTLDGRVDKALGILIVFFITYLLNRITAVLFNWYAVNVASKTKTDLDDRFLPLFRRIALTLIWSISIIITLSRLGININALVATLGVSSLAIALAAQDTISNIIAGFLIMIDQPFCVGDDIQIPSGEKVKVLDIGIRRSKFSSEEGAIIIMPNLDLSKSKIVNYTQGRDVGQNV